LIKSRRDGQNKHITNMELRRNKHVYRTVVGKDEENIPFRRYGRNCEDDVGKNIRQIK
jgi:hypothetical protein